MTYADSIVLALSWFRLHCMYLFGKEVYFWSLNTCSALNISYFAVLILFSPPLTYSNLPILSWFPISFYILFTWKQSLVESKICLSCSSSQVTLHSGVQQMGPGLFKLCALFWQSATDLTMFCSFLLAWSTLWLRSTCPSHHWVLTLTKRSRLQLFIPC